MIFSLLEKDVLGFSDDGLSDRKPDGAGGMRDLFGWTNGGPVRHEVCFSMLPFWIQCRSAFGSDPGILMISALFDGIINRAFGMIQAASGIAMTSETFP